MNFHIIFNFKKLKKKVFTLRMSIKLKLLDIINSKDKDIKKIAVNKTTLEIMLLFYKYELDTKEIISTDKFLEENQINASRSKKIAIIQNLEKNNIIEREVNGQDKRSKRIYINKEIKEKLKKILE